MGKSIDLVGMQGRVTVELAPRGIVLVGNETWTAVSEDARVIPIGVQVEVKSVAGLTLTVSRHENPNIPLGS